LTIIITANWQLFRTVHRSKREQGRDYTNRTC